MLGRRALFCLSVLAAALLYGVLFILAPRIEILHAGVRPETLARFNVYLRDPAEILPLNPTGERQAFTARPGSVRDLLKMDEELVVPQNPSGPDAGIGDLARRIGTDSIARPSAPMESTVQRLDAKILEITQESARRDVEVARRLVRPSPDTAIPADAQPTLREPGAFDSAPATLLPPSGYSSPLAEGPGVLGDAQQRTSERPESSEPLVRLEPVADLPELQAKNEPIRAPVRRAMEEAKNERNYGFMDDLLDIQLTTWRNPGNPEAYFEVRIAPKEGESVPVLPKDVTFVVDASSSIPQHKLNTTTKGVRDALRQLKPEDRFNLIVFRDSPQPFQRGVVQATRENLAEAEKFLGGLESRGETDVYKALQPVVQQAPREGTPGIVVVVSDGRPTTGLQDGRLIINGLTADNQNGNGIYAFGGGRTVNRYLLDLLAYRNKGAAEVTESIERIESEFPAFFAGLRDPILVDLQADFGRIDASTVYPRTMPDFFKGRAVTIFGRYRPGEEEEFTLWLAGKAGDSKKEVVFRTDFQAAEEGTREIARGWAFQKAYYIIGRISREGETPELLNELRTLRTEYGVRTSYDE